MNNLKFGEIVLLKFPFTDSRTIKKRPALVLSDIGDGDIIVCRVTSQLYDSEYDVLIENWEKTGLKLPSVIRVHKIAALQKSLVDIKIGHIENSLRKKVKSVFINLIK
jgi:mRNA interferase MazF